VALVLTCDHAGSSVRREMIGMVNVWSGNLPFSLSDPISKQARDIGRKYVDPYAQGKTVDAAAFEDAMAALREVAPLRTNAIVDELEFRWLNRAAPPALYVITHTVESRVAGRNLVAGNKQLGSRVRSTKVGKAKRSLAPRLAVYLERGYDHATIPDGTLSLRVVIYGNGRAMPPEPDIQRVARGNADRLYCECADGVTRPVSRESYYGTRVLTPLTDFAWQVERAGTPPLPGAASVILDEKPESF
jgi:hypothetical protein